jgi:serine O-acetyltransferase
VAKLLKAFNFLLYKAVLPYECEIDRDITLMHRGAGTVISPLTKVGKGATIGHGVTVTAGSHDLGSPHRAVIGDGVLVGAHSCISPRWGHSLTIGAGARIGINAVVIEDVPPGAKMIAPLASMREASQATRP